MNRLLLVLSCLLIVACGEPYQEPVTNGTGGSSNNGSGGTAGNNQGNGGAAGSTGNTCPDRDNDGYQDQACNPNPNGIPKGGDCNDYSNLANPGQREDCGDQREDNDCNGQPPARDRACLAACPDQDNDGYTSSACNSDRRTGGDCNDQDPTVNPGQSERCGNRKDDDCAGGDAPCLMNCTDGDVDGFGVGSGCYGIDCDDRDPNVNPWSSEICGDGRDQDCDGQDRACPAGCDRDEDRDGFGEGDGCFAFDCNDRNYAINPGARDIPGDGIDQDCDGRDLMLPADCQDRDQDGYGTGRGCLGTDCDDNDPRVNAGRTEICGNRMDDDCQGGDRPCVSMGTGQCMDMDMDGYGEGACPRGNLDCNEGNRDINPGAMEQCNGVDDDCDNRTDECAHRLQACHGGTCVGGAGAPCQGDDQCGPDAGLYCNRDLGQCRIEDGSPCRESAQCNPSAECTLVQACGAENLCYQTRGGPCRQTCDCTGKWQCHGQNNVCVECSDNGDCTSDNRNVCTGGGFCVETTELGALGGGGQQICNNTCEYADDDECDDGGPASATSACDYGSDCNDCGAREGMGGNMPDPAVDSLVLLLNDMIRCWSTWSQSNDNQGCYEINVPQTIYIGGAPVNQLGNVEAVNDSVCSRDWRNDNGFNGGDQDVLTELFGCGLLDIRNLWWPNALAAGSTGQFCMFYAPSKSGFGFPDDSRASIVIDRCTSSNIE